MRRERRKRHERLRGPVEAGPGGGNDRRRNLAAIPGAVQDATERAAAVVGLDRPAPRARARPRPVGLPVPVVAATRRSRPDSGPRADRRGTVRHRGRGRYRCPTDKVVWVNTKSRIYHYQGTHNYGHTKEGAYMCEADAKAAGDRAARTISNHRHTG